MLLGLTGGIATGKSTVSLMFAKCGAQIIDADVIARLVVEPGSTGAAQVASRFGSHLFDEQGVLDRQKLGELIFQDASRRAELNQILHPLIRQEMREQTAVIQQNDPDAIVIWDVPLLYEGKLTNQVEKVIVVYIPEFLQIERLMKRNQLTLAQAKQRIQSQLSIEQKKSLADYLIDNSGSYEHTERQVIQLWNYLS